MVLFDSGAKGIIFHHIDELEYDFGFELVHHFHVVILYRIYSTFCLSRTMTSWMNLYILLIFCSTVHFYSSRSKFSSHRSSLMLFSMVEYCSGLQSKLAKKSSFYSFLA